MDTFLTEGGIFSLITDIDPQMPVCSSLFRERNSQRLWYFSYQIEGLDL